MSNKVMLSPFTNTWKQRFEEESSINSKILGSNLLEIHHIGSTSIPGIFSKPIIDILSVVSKLTEVDLIKHEFTKRGYLYRGEFGIPGRRYIVGLGPNGIDHYVHIHIFQYGDPEITRHLFFRNFLYSNPDVAKEYENLKFRLRDEYEFDKSKYQAGKSKFCENLLRKEMGASYLPPKRIENG
jgi:GrpB-like predicted nucleotidyltransferase (UPF0157 family)